MNTANKLTVLRVCLVPVMILLMNAAATSAMIFAAAVFAVASVTDLLDGYIARKHDQITDFGKFLDPIADKLLVISALVELVRAGTVPSWVAVVFIAREFIISGFRMVAAGKGEVISAGMLGKIKTILQMVAVPALMLRSLEMPFLGIMGNAALYAALLMTIWSCADYIWRNRGVFSGAMR